MSPDGSHVSYLNPDSGVMTMMDWQTKEISWQANGGGRQARWSPDGSMIAALPAIFDTTSGQRLTEVEVTLGNTQTALQLVRNSSYFGYTDFQWSADSRKLAAMAYGYIVIYDFTLGEVTNIFDALLIPNADLYTDLAWFDWSPDGAKFAAFHFRIDGNAAVIPLEVVLGLWDGEGRWLSEYEQPTANVEQTCVPFGTDLARNIGTVGNDIVWSPDSQTVAVSASGITVCMPQGDGTLQAKEVYPAPYAAEQLHWSDNQTWLLGIRYDCTLLIADVSDNYTPYMYSPDIENCDYESAGWSDDGHYMALGTPSGLWVGTIESASNS